MNNEKYGYKSYFEMEKPAQNRGKWKTIVKRRVKWLAHPKTNSTHNMTNDKREKLSEKIKTDEAKIMKGTGCNSYF